MECIWSAETGFGSHPDHERSRPPSSTVLVVLSTVSARAGNRSVRVSWSARFTRVRCNKLSTQLRRTRTSSTVSPPVLATVADPEQTADSEQIRVATIALHTEQENTQNLQEAQVSQRRTLIRATNGPNSAISLKQIFNRIFVTGNILEYKKQKTGIGEQSCINAALKLDGNPTYQLLCGGQTVGTNSCATHISKTQSSNNHYHNMGNSKLFSRYLLNSNNNIKFQFQAHKGRFKRSKLFFQIKKNRCQKV